MKYQHLALGGTFDLLHRGHKSFLDFAFSLVPNVSIGITSDKMAKAKDGNIQSFEQRKKGLSEFVKERGFDNRSNIVILDDIYGTTLTDFSIDGLVVTAETKDGAQEINRKRQELGLELLAIIDCPMEMADDGEVISSTRIRRGEINREGFSYLNFLKDKEFILPGNLRGELQKPLGKQIRDFAFDIDSGRLVVSVGDETTKRLIGNGTAVDLAVVDLKVKREKVFESIKDLGIDDFKEIKISNKAGVISRELVDEISNFFQNGLTQEVIVVDGEEDLAVLPVVVLAPLGTSVFYGQPNDGVVKVDVSEKKKKEFINLLSQFQVKR